MSQTRTITIQGLDFEATTPYAEGHVCTEAEAKALNQTRLENLRNNFASKIKAAKGEGDEVPADAIAALRAEFAEYDASYVFTLASVGGGKRETDPVQAEAKKMARALITASLRDKGRKIKDVDKDTLDNAIATLAEREDIQKAAKKAVAERQKAAAVDLSELSL